MYKEVLRVRAFRDLWLGQAISQLGDSFYYVVFLFMVKKITGSDAMVGLIGALETLPFLVFSMYGGVLADRIDRRKIMLVTDILCGVTLLQFATVIYFDAEPPIAVIGATAFMLSTFRAFFMPARSATVPALVEPKQLMPAMALSQMTFSIAPMLGLAFAAGTLGVLYKISPQYTFVMAVVVNSLSFFGSAWFVRRLPKVMPERLDDEKHPWTEFVEGAKYIKTHGVLLSVILLSVSMSLMVSPFMVVYVATNAAWFGNTPMTLAFFELTFFVGMFIGSMWVGKTNIVRPGRAYIYSLILAGLAIAAMAVSPIVWLFCVWNLVCGIVIPFADVPINSLLQLSVPDGFRGRVNSVFMMLRMGVMPVGMGLAGYMVKGVGIFWSFMIMGLGMVAVSLVGLLIPAFRDAVMPVQASPTPDPNTNIGPNEEPEEPQPDLSAALDPAT